MMSEPREDSPTRSPAKYRSPSPDARGRSKSPLRERSKSPTRGKSRSPSSDRERSRSRSPGRNRSPNRRYRSPPRRNPRGTRVYVGHLSSRTDEAELDYKFGKYGRVKSIDVKNGYAFVDFENEDDADDAIRGLDGTEIDSSRVAVQMARTGGRAPRAPNPYRGVPPTHSDYRALFVYLPRSMSWQDLKDLCHQYGPRPVFTDVFRERGVYRGVAEFRSREELKKAVRDLDGRSIEGERIECYEDPRNNHSRSRSRSPSRSPPRKRRRRDSGSPRSPRDGSRSPSGRSPVRDAGSPKKKDRSPDTKEVDDATPPRRSSPKSRSPSP